MDKENLQLTNHCIQLSERKNLKITGVKKIENFDKKEFLLESIMGFILIKGENLELIKLDTIQGVININGIINSVFYLDHSGKNAKDNNLIAKLFK